MSNKSAKSEANAQYQAQLNNAQTAANQIKITPEMQALNDYAKRKVDLIENKGDVGSLPEITAYKSALGGAEKVASRQSATGSAALATDIANPELVAGRQNELKRGFEQDAANSVPGIVSNVYGRSADIIGATSGQSIGASSSRAGVFSNLAGITNQRYQYEASRGFSWGKLVQGAFGLAGQLGAASISSGNSIGTMFG